MRLSRVSGQVRDLYETPTGGKKVRMEVKIGDLIRNCV